MSCYSIGLLFLVASAGSLVAAKEVPVTIYYESLCPDSQKFFKMQFSPLYNSTLKNYIKPEFVPWGKANVTTDGKVNCQHGEGECEGNRLQACALHVIPDTEMDRRANYVICNMGLNVTTKTTTFPVEACNEVAGEYAVNISKCYTDKMSHTYLLEYQNKTETTFGNSTFGVPYVTFNGEKNDNISGNAVENFRTAVCANFKNLKECGGNSASTFTATLIPAAILLILGRL